MEIQVYEIDGQGFYTGKTYFVEEVLENHATKTISVGKVKPKWDFDLQDWVEGATEEEIAEWLDSQQIDNCSPIPTNEELNNQLVETQKLCLSLQKQILLK